MSTPDHEAAAPDETRPPAAEEPSAPETPVEPSKPDAPGEPEVVAAPAVPPVTVYGEGTPVVMLHAFPLDSRMWLPQVEALEGYQLIVPDLRGFGAARAMAGERSEIDLLADDVARLLDERELERVVLCGLSMGGYVALAFARRHPERLGGLVLLDTKAGTDSDDARANRLAMAERVLAEGIGFVPEVMLPRLLGETSLRERPEVVRQVTETILDQDPRGVAAAQRGMAERSDSTGALAQIDVPTLVVVGTEDELTGPDEARTIAEAVRDARLVQVPGAGHLVNLERPGPVNEAMLDFLAPIWI
jgi:pimeloyl-ACP methyl ester carboxylesterase